MYTSTSRDMSQVTLNIGTALESNRARLSRADGDHSQTVLNSRKVVHTVEASSAHGDRGHGRAVVWRRPLGAECVATSGTESDGAGFSRLRHAET